MIQVIDVNKFIKENKCEGPVTSTNLFVAGNQPDPKGLFSEKFFGLEGSVEYRTKYSWINLNGYVIHPFLFLLLKRSLERRIVDLLRGEKVFSIDRNGYLVEDPNGDITGMTSLRKNIHKIRFRMDKGDLENFESEEEFSSDLFRKQILKRVYQIIKDDLFFIDKILVIPPAFRPVSTLESGDLVVDPLNDIYRKILIVSRQLQTSSSILHDVIAYRMQLLLDELLDYVRTKISKKSGILRSYMLGKRVDFSARAVISPNPKIDMGYVGIPLRQVVQLFEPFILYGLTNSPYAKSIPEEFHKAVKEFLGRELELEI